METEQVTPEPQVSLPNLSFKQVQAYSKEEAVAQSGLKLDVKYDASSSYKKAQAVESDDPFDFVGFAHGYLKKKVKSAIGIGFTVVLEAGNADERLRPYKVDNVATEGTRKFKQVYQGTTEDGKVVVEVEDKGGATAKAKEVIKEAKGAIKTITIVPIKKVVEGTEVSAVVTYTPSVNTTLGTYIVFGYEA